jgi:two-component system OmpR family response regulator
MTLVDAPDRSAPSGRTQGHRGRVLVMLGDPEQSRALVSELSASGWKTLDAPNDAAGETGPDVLVTDPAGTALRRSLQDVPALFLASREAAAGFVGGTAMPSDDYLSGPFTAEDVVVRLCWLMRRNLAGRDSTATRPGGSPGPEAGPYPDVLVVGDLVLVPGSLLARRGSRSIALPKRQTALLALLMAHAGSVVGKAEILRQVWGEDMTSANWNKVELCASSLRRRIHAAGPPMIRTVRSAGYMIEAAVAG